MIDLLAGVEDWKTGEILAGVIWAIALGFCAGNYACSLVYRLPRGKSILEHKPYCGNCNTPLATKDLFPVISALLLRHKCRYCGTSIPISHFWTEIAIGTIFTLAFLHFNFSEAFVLIALLGTFLVTLTAIEANESQMNKTIMIVIFILGMLYRTLQDGYLFGFLAGGLYAVIPALIIWRKDIHKVNHIFVPSDKTLLLCMLGICAGSEALLPCLFLFICSYLLCWLYCAIFNKRIVFTLPISVAILAVTMYPELSYYNPLVVL